MQSQTWEEGAVSAREDVESVFFVPTMPQDGSHYQEGQGPALHPSSALAPATRPPRVYWMVTAVFYPPRLGGTTSLKRARVQLRGQRMEGDHCFIKRWPWGVYRCPSPPRKDAGLFLSSALRTPAWVSLV